MTQMGAHAEGVKRILSPRAFEDFQRKCEKVLSVREEVASNFRDIYPPGTEHLAPDGWVIQPWMVNWIRGRGGLDLKAWYRLQCETLIEWSYRELDAMKICEKAFKEKIPQEELNKSEWLSYAGHPPAFLVRADVGFASTVSLYGEQATVIYAYPNFWTGEFECLHGFHNQEGIPKQSWVVGVSEEITEHFDQEDWEKLLTPSEFVAAPKELSLMLDRKDFRTGFKVREIPKRCPYDLHEWLMPLRDTIMDVREEMFPRWIHATLYLATSSGNFGTGTQQNFWSLNQWAEPWLSMNCVRKWGIPFTTFTFKPMPEYVKTLLDLPKEVWMRSMAELFLPGPNGMLCDAVNKKVTSEEKTPFLHEIKRLTFEKGKMFKGFAIPYDDGIPPPMACMTSLPAPNYTDAFLKDLVGDPTKLSKEYKELLESEAGLDPETGRIPPYGEIPRLGWLFDPAIEWLKPKDFPPLDWSRGQIWPIDITREKMEIMVEEGYDGSGKDILHYSALADKKMGQLGKTIIIGTMPYKLPVP